MFAIGPLTWRETKSATKDAVLSENGFGKDLSQKIAVLGEKGLWGSRMEGLRSGMAGYEDCEIFKSITRVRD